MLFVQLFVLIIFKVRFLESFFVILVRQWMLSLWQVQVSILGAHAAVKTYAFACSKEGSPGSADGFVLLPLLAPHTTLLGRCWIGLLRDYTAIRTKWATKMQVGLSTSLLMQ